MPASGDTFALGTTTVHCAATDAHENTAEGSFAVTVQDTTPPAIAPHGDVGPVEATGSAGAVVAFTLRLPWIWSTAASPSPVCPLPEARSRSAH